MTAVSDWELDVGFHHEIRQNTEIYVKTISKGYSYLLVKTSLGLEDWRVI